MFQQKVFYIFCFNRYQKYIMFVKKKKNINYQIIIIINNKMTINKNSNFVKL